MSQFGTDITSDDILETLAFFDNWEDRYKYIIDLGRELPPLDEQHRTERNMVRGCQSQVWLTSREEIGRASCREGRDWSSDVCSSDLVFLRTFHESIRHRYHQRRHSRDPGFF